MTRHPVTGRFLAFDCEVDCLDHCAGLCGNMALVPDQCIDYGHHGRDRCAVSRTGTCDPDQREHFVAVK